MVANKLISINQTKPAGSQLPAVVNAEIQRVTGAPANVTALNTKLDEFKTWVVNELMGLAEAVQAAGGGGVDEAAVTALIEAQLTGMGPAIQQAIASQVGRLTDRADLNVSTAGDGPFVFETNNLTGAQYSTGIDFQTKLDGQVTVNGKRVLTEDDALASGGVDTAAINNQLLLLQSRIDDLEAENTVLKAELAKKATTEELNQKFDYLNLQSEATSGDLLSMIHKKPDKTYVDEQFANQTSAVDQLSTDIGRALNQLLGDLSEQDAQIVEWATGGLAQLETSIQGILDAVTGPNATLEMVQVSFTNLGLWLEQLFSAAGIEPNPAPSGKEQ